MNLNKFVPSGASRQVARQILVMKKHSPTILFGAGVVGVVTSTVLACRGTLKLEEILEEHHADVENAKVVLTTYSDKYTETDYKKDMVLLHVRTLSRVGKIYAPAFVVGGLAIAALTGSHNILSTRNAGLTAAYAALDKGFQEYRGRVEAEYGPDKERELRYGFESKTVVEETDKGPKKVVVKRAGPNGHSIYAKFFDQYNDNWNATAEYNFLFLRIQQTWANERLRAKGHLLLNDVYEALGLKRTKEGCVVGWVFDPDNPRGDNYIDFGVFNSDQFDRVHDFVTGVEDAILLDFNVDGVVYDLIENYQE